ncbi:MAG: amylo-alpha-1,6-glucosidase [Bacteroidales bacterium]
MSFLQFDKTQLINLEYSLSKEVILANRAGSYASSTIINCNTRKYHGLLIAPVESIDGGRHVLLSSLNETVIQHDQGFNLGIHKYPSEYYPKGHKYARWFELDPLWKLVYRVGGVVLHKEILLDDQAARVLVRYYLQEAHSPTTLRIKPFLAFRSIHSLSKSNLWANSQVTPAANGFAAQLYTNYPKLYVQTSKKVDFITAPDWYYQIEYLKEENRGYDFREDLVVPGYFEMPIRKGESIIISAGLEEIAPLGLKRRFTALAQKKQIRNTFEEVLTDTAKSFILEKEGGPEVVAGYHWFGSWGRFCWIALPGLTIAAGEPDQFIPTAKSMARMIRNGLFPNHSPDRNHPVYRGADSALWMIWALQQYAEFSGDYRNIWSECGSGLKNTLEALKNGTNRGIKLLDNGLIEAYLPNVALTWMNSYFDGKPVTQRPGLAVEVNALWYNAVRFAIELAGKCGDDPFIAEWGELPGLIEESFNTVFWDDERKYLADYVHQGEANWDVRPNQVFATSLPYSPLREDQKQAILELVQGELLTPKGLRTLSPRHEDFRGFFEGDHRNRDLTYHQGTVWPWLMGHFAEGWLRLYGKSGKHFIQTLIRSFEEDANEHGLGTLSEVYDGNPPHQPAGAVSFASSVAEILRIQYLLKKI